MTSWSLVTELILECRPENVMLLACPKCSQKISIVFDPVSPQPDGSTAGCLKIACWVCNTGTYIDGIDGAPSWVASLGTKLDTKPASNPPDSSQ